MKEVDMSAEAVTFRLKKVSQLRELCFLLKQARQKAGLHNDRTQEKLPKEKS